MRRDGRRPRRSTNTQASRVRDRGRIAIGILHIRGSEPLPLSRLLPMAGLRLAESEGMAPRITMDPSATASSKKLWRSLVKAR